jgi:hypothetical protein
MKTKRVLAALVGTTMALTMAGAVFAVDNNTALNQTGTAIDPTTFTHEGCDGAVDPGQVLWHFVYTADQDGISGHFAFSDGDQDLVSEDQGNIQAWNIVTDAGVTLDGSATWSDGTGGNFNLSHTCVGAEETATPPVETTAPPTPTLPQTNTIDQSNNGGTGTSLTLVFALILAVAGGLVAYAMRPRRVGNR